MLKTGFVTYSCFYVGSSCQALFVIGLVPYYIPEPEVRGPSLRRRPAPPNRSDLAIDSIGQKCRVLLLYLRTPLIGFWDTEIHIIAALMFPELEAWPIRRTLTTGAAPSETFPGPLRPVCPRPYFLLPPLSSDQRQ
jgi:hypothetical protein